MSIFATSLKMIRSGLAGAWKEASDVLHSRAHRVALKIWLAVFMAAASTIASIFAVASLSLNPVLQTLLWIGMGTCMAAANIAAIQTVYHGVKWFYFAGRQDELRAQRSRETKARRETYGDQAV
jgi:hypothetical protein